MSTDNNIQPVGYLWFYAERVQAVLLADGWHDVEAQTFEMGPALKAADDVSMSLPADATSGAFTFIDTATAAWISGPAASVLAIRTADHRTPSWRPKYRQASA